MFQLRLLDGVKRQIGGPAKKIEDALKGLVIRAIVRPDELEQDPRESFPTQVASVRDRRV